MLLHRSNFSRIAINASTLCLLFCLCSCANDAQQVASEVVVANKKAVAPSAPDRMDDVTDLSKKALLGDLEAANKIARTFSVDQKEWMEIAIQNGSNEFYQPYGMYLVGKKKHECYRAIFFLEKSLKVEHESGFTAERTKMNIEALKKQEKETNFDCGCDLSNAQVGLVCDRNDSRR